MTVRDVSTASIAELFRFDGRTAVVTGAGRGIGAATVMRLAEAGADVVVADLNEASAENTAQAALAWGGRAVATRVDVASTESIVATADRAVEALGGIDIWVNNAGIYGGTPLFEGADEVVDRCLAVNLRGALVGAREAARRMKDPDRGGVIVNVASTAGFRAVAPDSEPYAATKAGVVGLTRALAVTLGPAGIRVLGIAPSLTRTPGIEAIMADTEGMDAILAGLGGHLPIGRTAVPDDIARVILFCASDAAIFMTGTTVAVDGGELAH